MLVSSYHIRLSSMSTNSSDTQVDTLLGFPTELLIRIFAYLQVTELVSVQHTCRRFYDVISDSNSLQYFLHTEANHLEDFLPPDFSLSDRVALLKHHETAWNNLELNTLTKFVTSKESHAHHYLLQDGYLIYKAVSIAQYGYVDLYSSSALPHAEVCWTHIPFLADLGPLSDIVFAVDHNLAVAVRRRPGGLPVASFLEFTTGARHPLSLVPSVSLPSKPEVEVFGDYILVTAVYGLFNNGIFSVVSWKTGTYTESHSFINCLES
ncbi:hypothetical protein EI94DRAFT_1120864 [Lactarius quietus]|nr:hypothetical protein EI94DRAFT_1120864 [Lactarius quietus]